VLLDSHHSVGEALDSKSLTLPGYGVMIARRGRGGNNEEH
jgi:hypothetical protein